MKKKVKIGLIGCGTIGGAIATAIDTRFKRAARLAAVSDVAAEKAALLRQRLTRKPSVLSIDKLIQRCDLVIEAASARSAGLIAKKALRAGKDVMLMSTGGIVNDYAAIFTAAKKNGCKIYVPSGALCGLDGVKAALVGGISKAELITRKPPAGLHGAPYIKQKKIDLDALDRETVVFSGTAQEAVRGFPKNINVSCALSMAGIGPEKTTVTIIASPEYTQNTHEVIIDGAFGRMRSRAENVPSPQNPKTSYLAVLSAIATVGEILEPVRIGT